VEKQSVMTRLQAASAKVRRRVRRRIIINPAFQFRMLLPVVVFAVVQALLLGLFVFFPLHRSASLDPDPVVQAMFSEQLLNLHVRLWPMFTFAGVLACIYTLVRSNRVAGPLYKLRQSLLRMSEGEYHNMRFREGDEFRDLEGVANRLGQKMEALSSGNLRRMSKIEGRVKWLKARLAVQDLPRDEIDRELDSLLSEFSQVQILR
jgi:hypothetical protein